MLLVVTLSSGMLDLVSFLDLGQVFVSAMTGNMIFLGVGMTGQGELLPPALSLASYAVGAIFGGRLAFPTITHRGQLLLLGTAIHAAVVGIAALVATRHGLADAGPRNLVLVLLAFSMGWQYSVVLRLKVPDVTTTVVTTTITRLFGQASGPRARKRRSLMIGTLLCGALLAGLLRWLLGPPAPLWAAGLLLAACSSSVYLALGRPGAEGWR